MKIIFFLLAVISKGNRRSRNKAFYQKQKLNKCEQLASHDNSIQIQVPWREKGLGCHKKEEEVVKHFKHNHRNLYRTNTIQFLAGNLCLFMNRAAEILRNKWKLCLQHQYCSLIPQYFTVCSQLCFLFREREREKEQSILWSEFYILCILDN